MSSEGSGAPARDWAVFAVLAATLVAMWPTVHAGWLAADVIEVANRLTVSGALSPRAILGEADAFGRWQPLTVFAWKAGHDLGGGAAWGYHALSMAAHLAATSAAFLLARRVSGDARVGLLAALLFGLHPLQVESVAAIAALGRPLCTLFTLLAVNAWLSWRSGGSRGTPITVALAFLLAILADGAAIAVPLVIALADMGRRAFAGEPPTEPFAARLKPAARGYGALVAVVIVAYALRAMAYGDLTAGLDLWRLDYGVPAARLAWLRVEIVGGTLGLLAWPFGADTLRPFQPDPTLASRDVLVPLVGLLVWAGALTLTLRRRARPWLIAVAWPVAVLLPIALRLRTLGPFPLADRWAYAAVFGIALLFALGAFRWLPRQVASLALLREMVFDYFPPLAAAHDPKTWLLNPAPTQEARPSA